MLSLGYYKSIMSRHQQLQSTAIIAISAILQFLQFSYALGDGSGAAAAKLLTELEEAAIGRAGHADEEVRAREVRALQICEV